MVVVVWVMVVVWVVGWVVVVVCFFLLFLLSTVITFVCSLEGVDGVYRFLPLYTDILMSPLLDDVAIAFFLKKKK